MNCHILEHAFAVAFKAFTQGFGRILVGIVTDKGNVSTIGGLVLAGLAHKLADILVVTHEDRDALGGGVVTHVGQLTDGRGSGFFQVNGRATGRFDTLLEQARIVGGTTRNQGQTLDTLGRGRQFRQRLAKDDAVLVGRLLGKGGKFRSTRARGAAACVLWRIVLNRKKSSRTRSKTDRQERDRVRGRVRKRIRVVFASTRVRHRRGVEDAKSIQPAKTGTTV